MVEGDLRIDRTADAPAEHVEAEPLPGRDRELEERSLLRRRLARHDAGDRDLLGLRFLVVLVSVENLGQIVDAEKAQIRQAAWRARGGSGSGRPRRRPATVELRA